MQLHLPKTNINNLINVIACLCPILLLVTGKSYSYTPVIMMLLGLILLPKTKTNWDKEHQWLFISFGGYFFVVLLSILILGGRGSELDAPSRALLFVPATLLFTYYRPIPKHVLIALPLGAIITALISLYHTFILGEVALSERAAKGYMTIQSGSMAMSLGLFSLIVFFYFYSRQQQLYTTISALGFVGGVLSALLSGARGGWVLAPLIIFTICWHYRKMVKRKLLISIIASLCLVTYFSAPLIKVRLSAFHNDYIQYQEKNMNSSSGVRISLWKSSVISFLDKPIMGQGFNGRDEHKAQQVQEGISNPIILNYARAHSQYFEEAATKGTIGLATLGAFFMIPMLLFRRHYLQSQNELQKTAALLGIVHIIAVAGYCLTQNYLNHMSGILFYLTFVTLFISLSKPNTKAMASR